ncbi:MAG TPA: signal peptide peptidase SppA [Actinomycetota bacterium]|nr:signal peptide peptidase SppA [Actinomycetota bacterium]
MAGKKTKWFFVILAIVLVIGGLYGISIWLAGDFFNFGGGSFYAGEFDEEVIEEGDSTDKIALINVVGEIFSDPEGYFPGASDTLINGQLEQAYDDPDVKAVIINLETPGGGVVASDLIYQRVVKLREQGKPVVALMGDIAASGGYYIAAGADRIVAHPSTWTGSIGVIAMLPNFEVAINKIGVGVTVLKSGAMKDAGSPFRAMTPEEQALFQTLIDEAYAEFVNAIADGRSIPREQVVTLADGRIYSGTQAKQAGLVDELGSQDDAFRIAKELGEAKEASLVRYSQVLGFSDLLTVSSQRIKSSQIKQELGIPRRPGAAYLWIP